MEERNTETTGAMNPAIIVSANPVAMAEQAAAEFLRLSEQAIKERGVFLACLSGGSTPVLLYDLLADADLYFEKSVFFFGDERDVPPDHPESNYRLACEHLFRSDKGKSSTIYRWHTEMRDREETAFEYETTILRVSNQFNSVIQRDNFPVPRFDLILLGIGEDGHTASLFPHTTALHESQRIAVANFVDRMGIWRYTLTFPAINNARNIIFLAAGEKKAEAVRMAVTGKADISDIPAAGVRPVEGNITWFLDEESAMLISAEVEKFQHQAK